MVGEEQVKYLAGNSCCCSWWDAAVWVFERVYGEGNSERILETVSPTSQQIKNPRRPQTKRVNWTNKGVSDDLNVCQQKRSILFCRPSCWWFCPKPPKFWGMAPVFNDSWVRFCAALKCRRLAKRRTTLWKHNSSRDSQVNGECSLNRTLTSLLSYLAKTSRCSRCC